MKKDIVFFVKCDTGEKIDSFTKNGEERVKKICMFLSNRYNCCYNYNVYLDFNRQNFFGFNVVFSI